MKRFDRIPPAVVTMFVVLLAAGLGLIQCDRDPYTPNPAEAALRKRVDIPFDNSARLAVVFAQVSARIGVPVVADWASLESIGVKGDMPIPSGIRRRTVGDILRNLDGALIPDVRSDDMRCLADGEVVRVMSESEYLKWRVTWNYDISFIPPMPRGDAEERTLNAEIMRLIAETVSSESWPENGGRVGEIACKNGHMTVTHTVDRQIQIGRLMGQLEELRGSIERWRHIDVLNRSRPRKRMGCDSF